MVNLIITKRASHTPAAYKYKISANLRLTLRRFTFDNIKTLTHHTFGIEIPSDMLLSKEGHLLQIHQAGEMLTECEILARDADPYPTGENLKEIVGSPPADPIRHSGIVLCVEALA